MRVALDISRMHILSRNRGIGVYAQNLFDALRKYTNVNIELVEKKINYDNFDLVHFPFFDLYSHTLPLRIPKPTLVTIHDLIPLQYPKYYPIGIKARISWQLQKLALKKVKLIISVSETVKTDIERLLKISGEKIQVVHSAPSENFRKIPNNESAISLTKKFNLPDEFILYVGNVNWNKNILNITEGVLNAGINLVIVGGSFLDKKNLEHPEQINHKEWLKKYNNNEKITILDDISQEELNAIMNRADSLVFASYYEGFGLPILEAQACGLPVITSNYSATAEVAGKGALLVSPSSSREITKAVETIKKSGRIRQDLILKGYENVKKYSWKKTAHNTLRSYEKVFR